MTDHLETVVALNVELGTFRERARHARATVDRLRADLAAKDRYIDSLEAELRTLRAREDRESTRFLAAIGSLR